MDFFRSPRKQNIRLANFDGSQEMERPGSQRPIQRKESHIEGKSEGQSQECFLHGRYSMEIVNILGK